MLAIALHAETGRDAWLRYAPQPVENLPAVLATTSDSPLITSARDELVRGIRSMTGKTLRLESGVPKENAIILNITTDMPPDAYSLKTEHSGNIIVTGASGRGVLYGAFALLRKIALGQTIANLDEKQTPTTPIRWINQWDRLDGTIERGYGGRSIFWEHSRARADL